MKHKSLYFLLSAVAAFALMNGDSVEACNGGCGNGGCGGVYGLGVYGNYGGSPYAASRIPTPPYFALHPPVHYQGRPVPRSYGYSPFAYSARTETPTVAENVQAQVIVNPYIRKAVEEKAKPIDANDDRVAAITPEIIRNPFVTPTGNRVKMANVHK